MTKKIVAIAIIILIGIGQLEADTCRERHLHRCKYRYPPSSDNVKAGKCVDLDGKTYRNCTLQNFSMTTGFDWDLEKSTGRFYENEDGQVIHELQARCQCYTNSSGNYTCQNQEQYDRGVGGRSPIIECVVYDSNGNGYSFGSQHFDTFDECEPFDDDNDKINNCIDQCPDTESGAFVDETGCKIFMPTADEIGRAVEYYMSDEIPTAYSLSQEIAENIDVPDWEEIMGENRAADQAAALDAKTSLEQLQMPGIEDLKTIVEQEEIPEFETGTGIINWLEENNPVIAAITGSGFEIENAICAFSYTLPNNETITFTCCQFENEMENFGILFLSVSILGSIIFIQT